MVQAPSHAVMCEEKGGREAPQFSLLALSPQLKGSSLLGCEGEERGKRREEKGGSTHPKATVMGITVALTTDLEEGPDPSCPVLFEGFPRAPDPLGCDPQRLHPTSSSCSHTPEPRFAAGCRGPAVPPFPTCLQLARRPRRQLTLEVRVSTMGVPSPTRPRSVRHGGRSARALALPTQARRHPARRVGDMRLPRAPRSPAWVNQTQSMSGPRGDTSANGATREGRDWKK